MNCLLDDFKKLTAPTTAYIEAFDDFCKNINVLNVTCYQESTIGIRQCLSKNFGSYQIATNSSFDDKKTFACKGLETVVRCHSHNTVLKTCPGTRDMLLKYSEILKPPACGAMMIISSIMLLVLSMMLFVSTVY
ncbi:hypothetical protein SNE40_022924 [Patella caerulea]|uniref:Uncharacterized protein n=1 Tax=Patella caerulea TaxID=87958 RepID=A0AAN8G1R6_PATCE